MNDLKYMKFVFDAQKPVLKLNVQFNIRFSKIVYKYIKKTKRQK